MKPKVHIQIILTENGECLIQSTSSNQVTNLGLLSVADAFFKGGLQKKEESPILKPRFEVP